MAASVAGIVTPIASFSPRLSPEEVEEDDEEVVGELFGLFKFVFVAPDVGAG